MPDRKYNIPLTISTWAAGLYITQRNFPRATRAQTMTIRFHNLGIHFLMTLVGFLE